jgi:hypothetical protein
MDRVYRSLRADLEMIEKSTFMKAAYKKYLVSGTDDFAPKSLQSSCFKSIVVNFKRFYLKEKLVSSAICKFFTHFFFLMDYMLIKILFSAKAVRNEMIKYLINDCIVPALLNRSLHASDVEDLHQLLYQLFNDETTKIVLKFPREDFWYGARNRVKPMLEQISANAPNLQELEISRYEKQRVDMISYDRRVHPTLPFGDINRPWTSLENFKLHYWNCSDQDLALLTKIIPNVVRLEVCNNLKLICFNV